MIESSALGFEIECFVMGLCEILSPQIQFAGTKVEQKMSSQSGIKILVSIIVFRPIHTSETVGVGPEGDGVKIRIAEWKFIICQKSHGVFGNERNFVAGVVRAVSGVIAVERGVGVTVIKRYEETVVEEVAAHGRFNAAAVTAPCINHHSAHTTIGETCDLLIVRVCEES